MHAFVPEVEIATIKIVYEANHFNALFKTQNYPIEQKIAQKVIYVTKQLLDYTVQEL